jgi:hypothetical protein
MQTITAFDNAAEGWERSLYAFLAEKERRSGSRRTVEGYSRMLQHFFAKVGKPPDRHPRNPGPSRLPGLILPGPCFTLALALPVGEC